MNLTELLQKFGHTPLSYSAFKSYFQGGLSNFWRYKERELEDKSTVYTDFGNLLDLFILEPEVFKEKYTLMQVEKPSSNSNQNSFAKDIWANGFPIVEAYSRNYKVDKKSTEKIEFEAEKLYDTWKDYIVFMKENKDKEFYNESDNFAMNQIKMNMMSHKAIRKLFCLDHKPDSIELLTHLELTGKWYGNAPIKGELDLLRIDHENKTIRPIDLKSTESYLQNWGWKVRNFMYDIQGVLYPQLVSSNYEFLINDEGYELLPMVFAVSRTKGDFASGAYTLPADWIKEATSKVNDAIEDITQAYELNQFTHPKAYYEGDGIIELEYNKDLRTWMEELSDS